MDLATNAYGQGIAVTAIQMVRAVSAIANGGILMKPMIVRAYADGDVVREMPPVQLRRVISSETARTLTGMMVHVVEDNSLRLSVVPGYKIAGKTGTADLPTRPDTRRAHLRLAGGLRPGRRPKVRDASSTGRR